LGGLVRSPPYQSANMGAETASINSHVVAGLKREILCWAMIVSVEFHEARDFVASLQ